MGAWLAGQRATCASAESSTAGPTAGQLTHRHALASMQNSGSRSMRCPSTEPAGRLDARSARLRGTSASVQANSCSHACILRKKQGETRGQLRGRAATPEACLAGLLGATQPSLLPPPPCTHAACLQDASLVGALGHGQKCRRDGHGARHQLRKFKGESRGGHERQGGEWSTHNGAASSQRWPRAAITPRPSWRSPAWEGSPAS